MHVQQHQGRNFLRTKKTLRDAPQRRQGLGSTICRDLPLIDRSFVAIWCYLPLIDQSSAAICR
jgi:hypothetical protein